MMHKQATYGELTGPVLWPESGAVRHAVVLLHGLGADGQDLIDIGNYWRPLLPDTLFFAPNAPFACDMAPWGYQWFSLQQWDEVFIEAGVRQVAGVLHGMLDALMQTHALAARDVALGGFSQGCMMSLHVGLRRKEALACLVGYSGMLVRPEQLQEEMQSRPPVLLVHGRQDMVVPFHHLATAEKTLKALRVPVETLACEGLAHGIDEAGLQAGLRQLQAAFTPVV